MVKKFLIRHVTIMENQRKGWVDRIRINEPLTLGERANITVIARDGSWQNLKTSPIQDYMISHGDSISLTTKNTVYRGTLENPEIFSTPSSQDFKEAVEALSQPSGRMEL